MIDNKFNSDIELTVKADTQIDQSFEVPKFLLKFDYPNKSCNRCKMINQFEDINMLLNVLKVVLKKFFKIDIF